MKTTTTTALPIPHPGDTLREDFMEPLRLTTSAVARALGVALITISLLVRGKHSISPEMALRLAAWSGSTPAFWMGLQSFHDERTTARLAYVRHYPTASDRATPQPRTATRPFYAVIGILALRAVRRL